LALIVGLGNPGDKYANTRHNIGFMVIDKLINHLSSSSISKASFEGELSKKDDLYLLKPTTFMNLSGKSVLSVKQFYKLDVVIVIHDDLDLPFGALRYKMGGGHGGHNGLKSIDSLITKEYLRVRMGIGKPEHKGQVADYVLHDFSKLESEHMDEWIDKAAKATLALLENDLASVASKYSQKRIIFKEL
jgi:peptidyl-tRNA hydrolase, PTH1 family